MRGGAEDGIRSVRAVERACDLLEVLESSGRSLRLTEVARSAAMHKATTQRLLNVLERRGWVHKVRGRYQVGVASLPLAHAFRMGNSLSRAALPVLRELSETSGETATLFVRLGFSRVAVERVEGKHGPRYSLPIGQRLPLHLGAGRVLAAAMQPAELERVLGSVGEMRLATGEVVPPEALLEELTQIRANGFYVAWSERTLGQASVSAPVTGAEGQTLAAVCVTVDAARLGEERARGLSVEVRQAAQAIAERLVYD
jgi:IclR family acetate operon transcriptional repressor